MGRQEGRAAGYREHVQKGQKDGEHDDIAAHFHDGFKAVHKTGVQVGKTKGNSLRKGVSWSGSGKNLLP